MDEVFGEIMGLGYGSDSIMLRLLRSAMDEAHENVQSKDRPIELLNARSKFYEMAMILVQGCSELIEKKEQIPEINREKMLTDLQESKDMVRGRLEEIKFSISDKDIELAERVENEIRLRQKMETKEKELVSLRARLQLDRTKSEEKEGDFCDLKNSVDQQMLNIKQKLEDERMSLSSANELFGDEDFEDEQNLVIEQMSSDIDCLKGTLDLAFGRMQNAEIGPLENQWRWKIEKDTIFITISGFMIYVHDIFKEKLDENLQDQEPFGFSGEQWDAFIKEITSLHNELKSFTNDINESQDIGISSQENGESSRVVSRTSSEPIPEMDNLENSNENHNSEAKTFVAKLIKNHESIIRKQSEDLNWIKFRDVFRGKESSSGKKNLDPENLGGRIKEIVSRLDYFIKWNEKIHRQKSVVEKIKATKKEKIADEINKLNRDRDELSMQIMFMEDTYVTLMKGFINDLSQDFYNFEIGSLVEDEVGICVFREVMNEWRLLLEYKNMDEMMESVLKEDVYMVVFRNFLKEIDTEIDCSNFENSIREEIYNFIILEATIMEAEAHDQSPNEKSIPEEDMIESVIKEDVYMVVFRNFLMEIDTEIDCRNFENSVREEIYNFIILEATISGRKPVMEAEAHGQSPSKKSALEEENLIHKADSSEKCFQNQKDLLKNKKLSQRTWEREQVNYLTNLCSTFKPLVDFQSMFGEFESMAHQKLEMTFLRLEELTHKTQKLLPSMSSIRKGELLYRKAFEIRCHNLRLAETEVDLLGDQVEEFVHVLQSIYSILDQNLKTTCDFWVSEIRSLIKEKLDKYR